MREPPLTPASEVVSGILLVVADETRKLNQDINLALRVMKGTEEWTYMRLLGVILGDQFRTAQEIADALPRLDHCLQELTEEYVHWTRLMVDVG